MPCRKAFVPSILIVKKQNMKFPTIYLFPAAIALSLASCGNTPTGDKTAKEEVVAASVPADVPETTPTIRYQDPGLQAQLGEMFALYLEIQTALTRDQATEAAKAAASLSSLADRFNAAKLPDSLREAYDAQAKDIGKSAAGMAQQHDIAQQRVAFAPLSEQVLHLLRLFGTEKPVYETHCPMAFDNKGANWLSDKPEVRNPYFGDQMLECGEITAMIRKRQ